MKLILEYIKKYKLTYILIMIIFIIGLLVGVAFSFKTNEAEKLEIESYITNSIQNLQNNKDKTQEIFFSIFSQNAKFTGAIWALGCTIIAGFLIYVLIFYKGFLLGYIISMILKIFGINLGGKYLCLLVMAQNIVFLPMMFLLATSGIRLYKGIIKKDIDLKYELIRHCIIGLLTLCIAIVSSCLESYFSIIFL